MRVEEYMCGEEAEYGRGEIFEGEEERRREN